MPKKKKIEEARLLCGINRKVWGRPVKDQPGILAVDRTALSLQTAFGMIVPKWLRSEDGIVYKYRDADRRKTVLYYRSARQIIGEN